MHDSGPPMRAPSPDCNWGRRVTAPRVSSPQWPGAQGVLTEEAPETAAQGPGLARPCYGTLRGADPAPLNPPQLSLPHLCHHASRRLTRGQPRLLSNSTTSVGCVCKQLFFPSLLSMSLRTHPPTPSTPLWDLWWNKCQPEETGTHQHFIPGRYINAVMVSRRRGEEEEEEKKRSFVLVERDKGQSVWQLLRMLTLAVFIWT